MKKFLILLLGLVLMTSLVAATHDSWTYCKINMPDVCGMNQECIEHRVEMLNEACNMPDSECFDLPCVHIPEDVCTMQLPYGQLGVPYDNENCQDNQELPEFSGIATGLALAGAGVGFMVLRKRR